MTAISLPSRKLILLGRAVSVPAINGVSATLFADYVNNIWFVNGVFYPTKTAWTAAINGLLSPWFNVALGTWLASGTISGFTDAVIVATNDNAGNYNTGSGQLLRLDSPLSYAFGGNATSASVIGPAPAPFKIAGVFQVSSTLQRVVAGDGSTAENTTLDYTGTGSVQFRLGALTSGGVQPFTGTMHALAYIPVVASIAQATVALASLTT